ncbi:hypothetical protein BH11PSE13_BH11PSE13_12450 [soil metagenome]
MKATGLFFLTKRPVQVVLISPTEGKVRGWEFDLVERLDDKSEVRMVALWRGVEADRAVIALWENLKAGCALSLDLERIRVKDGAMRARIVACALAPARWPGRSEAASSALASAITSARSRSTLQPRPSAA